MKKQEKTNVMRLLDQHEIEYNSFCYVDTEAVNGEEIARILNEDPDRVFKTLVTAGHTGANYVFMLPVNQELDLKKAAMAVGEKSIEMIKAKELLPLTGYIHGGCSPIGMKKFFRTTIDETACLYETIFFSAGKVGYQVEVKVADIEKIITYEMKDITI